MKVPISKRHWYRNLSCFGHRFRHSGLLFCEGGSIHTCNLNQLGCDFYKENVGFGPAQNCCGLLRIQLFWRLDEQKTEDGHGFKSKTCVKEAKKCFVCLKNNFLFLRKEKSIKPVSQPNLKSIQLVQFSCVDETENICFRKECFPV